jgi:hypothetical protein
LDEKVQIEKEPKELTFTKAEDKPQERTPDISPERIERMKRAFRPTWLQDQINSNGKTPPTKKD